ncbi:amphoterin-induced protein 2-like [Alosa sapidissima]|uniref:amphoterin-induced protein 2-like n=1 Tax=Alosa sapidissima TaxID=34773 RepID=UPI001C096505|nr:amphoterin-induced protein 2-like [Alosa sapidissima]
MGANREAHEVCRKSLAMLLFVCFALSMYIGCSHACFSSVDIVICRGQNFSAVPANLSDLIWRLDLGSNAITSLSSSWTPRPLLRLEVLVLAQNALGTIVPGAFVSTPHLRHLDLSSNRLKWLIGGIFKGLGELEELLLFDNHLGRISGWAFEGLGGLQRLHLGRNRLTQLPPEMFDGVASLSKLRVFDLSSNMLRGVPVASILTLPHWTQAALYLHDNPLVCTCALRSMLQQWADKHYRTMVDFRHGHPCLRGTTGEMLNCSWGLHDSTHPVKVVSQVRLGEQLLLLCLDSTEQQGSSVHWDTPDQEALPGEDHHLHVHSNGTLEIQRVRLEDSGTYHCKVISGGQQGSEKLVEVVVSDSEIASTPHQSENVHTGFTALVSWMVSIILLLSYLYFSPCHCCCRRKHLGLSRPAKGNPQLQAQPSTAKKVVFVEPWMEVTAIDVAHSTGDSTGAANPVTTRSILKNGGNTSDPPIREICHLI